MGALAMIAPTVKDVDDFMVIVTQRGDDRRFGALDWDYYGYSAAMEPYFCLTYDRDLPYQARARYIVLAEDETRARRALEESGVDAIMRGAVRLTGRSGRLGIYEALRDDDILARYRAAAADVKAPAALRAAGLTGLGVAFLSRGNLIAARDLLEKARVLAPENEKIRYQLGRTYYLAFDDKTAAGEFGWVVSHDTQNVHAPLYLADTLAQLGRPQEALKWYQWYFDAGRPPEGQIFTDVCKLGIAAVKQGKEVVRAGPGDEADGWMGAAMGFHNKGSFERAVMALRHSNHLKPVLGRLVWLAQIHAQIHEYAESARILRSLLGRVDDAKLHDDLAQALRGKDDFDGARAEVRKALALNPHDELALALEAEYRRL